MLPLNSEFIVVLQLKARRSSPRHSSVKVFECEGVRLYGGGFHSLFPEAVLSVAGVPYDGAMLHIEKGLV